MRQTAVIAAVLVAGLWARPAAAADPVTLRWEPIPGAVSYDVEIAADRELTNIVEKQNTAATRLKWTPPEERPYWWRVRGVDANGLPGEFSAAGIAGSAVLEAPVLDSPEARASFPDGTETVRLSWRAADRAVRYRIEVARDAAFAKVVASAEVAGTEWSVERPSSGKHYWRVTATDSADRASAPSVSRSFTVKRAPVVALIATPSPAATPEAVASATPEPASRPTLLLAGGGRLGVFHNFGEVTSPLPAVEVSVQRSRIRAALQASHYSARISPSSAGVTVRSSLIAYPVTFLATIDQPIGPGAAYGGGGVSATFFEGAVAAPGQRILRSRSVTPGAQLLAGYGLPLGRTVVTAETAFTFGTKTDGLVEASSSGLSFSVGFRVPFGGRGRP
jgi:hypothetical protein